MNFWNYFFGTISFQMFCISFHGLPVLVIIPGNFARGGRLLTQGRQTTKYIRSAHPSPKPRDEEKTAQFAQQPFKCFFLQFQHNLTGNKFLWFWRKMMSVGKNKWVKQNTQFYAFFVMKKSCLHFDGPVLSISLKCTIRKYYLKL